MPVRFSMPTVSLSSAYSTSDMLISSLSRRAVTMAASLSRFIKEAPEKPVVRAATMARSTDASKGLLRACTFKMASRPVRSGRSTGTRRSKRPGRSKAGSSTSARLVAAITTTPLTPSNPSISVSSWLSVCSASLLPPPPLVPPAPPPRLLATASISSMKMMHGAFFLALAKISRTRLAPTPTNISTNSEPEHEMKGTPASPATARASKVLPVPGGPSMSTPRGARAPTLSYLVGSVRNSTTSDSSSLLPSHPATSLNVTPVFGSISSVAFDLPSSIGFMPPGPPPMPPPPAPPRDERKLTRRKIGKANWSAVPASAKIGLGGGGAEALKSTSFLMRSSTSCDWAEGRTEAVWMTPSTVFS
mmetsp:Transcript_5633/g.10623  ORF Transcript_5633/g.10623 Transcript_5633/m.10623 type:complete len:361 (+) Transcript_5633:879-1961(+)